MKRSSQAFNYIKEKIINREWLPGQAIKEEVVAKSLGFSRTPIRQAFNRLQEEGLLLKIDNKGVFVAEKAMSKKDFQEAVEFFELMSLHYLQNLEMKEAIFSVDDLEETLLEMENLLAADKGRLFLEAEYRFWKFFLKQAQYSYHVSLMLQTLQMVFRQEGYIKKVLDASREEKMKHFQELIKYLKINQFPYARRELRILFNQLVLNVFQGPAGTPL